MLRNAASRRSLLLGSAAAAVVGASAGPAYGRGSQVETGASVAAAQGWRLLRGRRVAVLSNPTGVLPDTRHIVDDLAQRADLHIVGVLGPEHGFRGSSQAGGSEPETKDPRTGLTVYDAYGADTAKLAGLLKKMGADLVLFDIQDVGVRYYTYVWTMYRAMAAAREVGAGFLVLDRPNPLGRRVDGPLLDAAYASDVGLKPIVQQHGMTVGELARYFNGELLPHDGGPVRLEVVPVRGWSPQALAQDTGLIWVPPSPNIPGPDSATVYAGNGWFEGTNLSEGRGTTRPFEVVGAPYLDYRYSDRLNAYGLPGVRFREAYFVPTFEKYVGQTCAGVELHVTDPHRYRALSTAAAMLVEARAYDGFSWRHDKGQKIPYAIDRLSGSARLRTMVDAGADAAALERSWRDEAAAFAARRRPYLLY